MTAQDYYHTGVMHINEADKKVDEPSALQKYAFGIRDLITYSACTLIDEYNKKPSWQNRPSITKFYDIIAVDSKLEYLELIIPEVDNLCRKQYIDNKMLQIFQDKAHKLLSQVNLQSTNKENLLWKH